jgi:hypothetical protein
MSSPPANYRPRRAGSARFSTYYKVQWFDATSLCWFDIQKQHPNAEAARAAYLVGKQCRILEITPTGRRPL